MTIKIQKQDKFYEFESEFVKGHNAAVRQFAVNEEIANSMLISEKKAVRYTKNHQESSSYEDGYHKALENMQKLKCTR